MDKILTLLSNLVNGLQLGSVYAIIALGYTMVYGIAKMLNFAHGDIIMVGAYVVFLLFVGQGFNPLLALVISIAACTVMGILIEKIAYKPLRKAASPLAVLITAIGVSYFLLGHLFRVEFETCKGDVGLGHLHAEAG